MYSIYRSGYLSSRLDRFNLINCTEYIVSEMDAGLLIVIYVVAG